MDAETKIYINNDLGIVMARMQTRDIAKQMGFSTSDQARISLAASEMARILSWSRSESSEMVISPASKNGHQGLQVVCFVEREHLDNKSAAADEQSVPHRSFKGACKLVDESSIETHDDAQAQVTLIKWLK